MNEQRDPPPPHLCESMAWALADSVPVEYNDRFREYGIHIQDGGSSVLLLNFCPFCGLALPTSLRDEWFERCEALGIDDPRDGAIPAEMQSGSWWRRELPSLGQS